MMDLLIAIRNAEADVDIADQHLIVCRRNLKVMENLREKKFQEYTDNEERKERKFLDEQATLRHHRAHFESSSD